MYVSEKNGLNIQSKLCRILSELGLGLVGFIFWIFKHNITQGESKQKINSNWLLIWIFNIKRYEKMTCVVIGWKMCRNSLKTDRRSYFLNLTLIFCYTVINISGFYCYLHLTLLIEAEFMLTRVLWKQLHY